MHPNNVAQVSKQLTSISASFKDTTVEQNYAGHTLIKEENDRWLLSR